MLVQKIHILVHIYAVEVCNSVLQYNLSLTLGLISRYTISSKYYALYLLNVFLDRRKAKMMRQIEH